MLRNSVILAVFCTLVCTSGAELVTKFNDQYEHPCERLKAVNESFTWAQDPRGCAMYFYCGQYPDSVGYSRCPSGYRFLEQEQVCIDLASHPCSIDEELWGAQCDGINNLKVPHPHSCFEYTVCIENLEADFHCPDGLHFSPYDQDCVEPSRANCPINAATCQDAEDFIPKYIPSSRDCSTYYVCFNGYLQKLQCGPYQHFDSQGNYCLPAGDADCDESALPELSEIPNVLSIDCTQHLNGSRVAHPDSCDFWFFCINGRSQMFRCGEGSKFDVVSKNCKGEDLAVCPAEEEVTEEPETTEESQTTEEPTGVKNLVVLDAFPHPPVLESVQEAQRFN